MDLWLHALFAEISSIIKGMARQFVTSVVRIVKNNMDMTTITPLVDFTKEMLADGEDIESVQRELSKVLDTYNKVDYVITLATKGYVNTDSEGRVLHEGV